MSTTVSLIIPVREIWDRGGIESEDAKQQMPLSNGAAMDGEGGEGQCSDGKHRLFL